MQIKKVLPTKTKLSEKTRRANVLGELLLGSGGYKRHRSGGFKRPHDNNYRKLGLYWVQKNMLWWVQKKP